MKKLFVYIAILTFIPFIYSCNKNSRCDGLTKQHLEINDFTSLRLVSDFNVQIIQSDSVYLVMEGCENDLNNMDIERGNNSIQLKRGNKKSSNQDIKLIIGMRELEFLKTNGTVDVEVQGFTTDIPRKIESNGAGNTTFNGNASTMEIALGGNSELLMSGTAAKLLLDLNGVSLYDGFNFVVGDASVSVVGNSLAQIHATQSLTGEVKGASTVEYKGVNAHSVANTGASNVINKN